MKPLRFYLAGSMYRTKDYGKSWRIREQRWLESFGVEVFSPPDREPVIVKRFGISQKLLESGSTAIDKSVRIPLFRAIIRHDLKEIKNNCDAVIVNFTKESAGTCSEITWAFKHSIPVHLVSTSGTSINPWVEACCTTTHKSWQRLRAYLQLNYQLKKK